MKQEKQLEEITLKNRIYDERRNLNSFLSRYDSLCGYIQECITTYPDLKAITDPYSDVELTYKELEDRIEHFASGLQSLGVKKGDFICIFSESNGLWCSADQAIMRCGAVTTPRGTSATLEELNFIINHSECRGLVLQNEKILKKMMPVLTKVSLSFIIMLFDKGEEAKKELKTPIYTYDEILEMGKGHKFVKPEMCLDDVSTMLYTSGTTGMPKGVLLTHKNILSQYPCVDYGFKSKPGENTLQILPIWHSYERTAQMYYLSKCCHMYFTNISGLKKDLVRFKPDTLMSVPRIWDAVYEGIFTTVKKQSRIAYCVLNVAVFISIRYIIHKMYADRDDNTKLPFIRAIKYTYHKFMRWALEPMHRTFTLKLYKKIKDAAGLNFRATMTGGGSLAMHVQLFYEAIGVNLREGYGLTETSPVLTLRDIEKRNYLGSSGMPVKATEIKIVDPETKMEMPHFTKGLIMARGPQIMKGYYKDEAATKAVIDENGWFNTGDLGWLTSSNNLVIVGREKETIVLSNGENVEPVPIEGACLESPYISQIVLVGQDEDNLGALIVPSEEAYNKCRIPKESQSVTLTIRSIQNQELKELIKKEIQTHIKSKPNLKSFEYIKQFALIKDSFNMDNGMMSSSGKIKRNNVFEKYKDIISDMFNKKK